MKKALIILFILILQLSFGQGSKSWGSYFSFNHIKAVTPTNDRIFASTENVLFSKDIITNEIKTTTTVDGLKAQSITALYHSESINHTFIGNNNGLLIVINQNNNKIINKVDIINELPVSANKKKINHFYEFGNRLYISSDYGISVLNLTNLEFEDTWYIGNNGGETEVLQIAIWNGNIYAVTRNQGIKFAYYYNEFLIDYNQWSTYDYGYWTGILVLDNQIVLSNSNGDIARDYGAGLMNVISVYDDILHFTTNNNLLIVTTKNKILIYNNYFNSVKQYNRNEVTASDFTCATIINNNLYFGTQENGIHSININSTEEAYNFTPNGPLKNKVVKTKATQNNLWCVFGENSYNYNPHNPDLSEYGISKYNFENGWMHFPYSQLLGAKNISSITPQPNNENIVYFGTNHSGILKIVNNQVTDLFNNTNTGQNGLESVIDSSNPNYISVRNLNIAFDRSRNLWTTNALVNKSLKTLKTNGDWESYTLQPTLVNPGINSYGDLVIDKNNTKWIATQNEGVVAFNENYNNKKIKINNTTQGGNLPDLNVRTLAIDKNNRLWIGTQMGLRVLSSIDSFINNNVLNTNAIIIMEDGLAQELLYRQAISVIKVDGANNKWIGTMGAGVFLVSASGQETIARFTQENSPLPSNIIYDIDINPTTGEVFFATEKGMVSYKGVSTEPNNNLKEVIVYPNPVRPEYTGTVKISGLVDKANVKITDIEGNLVHEVTAEGGTIEWDTTAFGRYKVASGVYLIFIASEKGDDTTVKKVMIVR